MISKIAFTTHCNNPQYRYLLGKKNKIDYFIDNEGKKYILNLIIQI